MLTKTKAWMVRPRIKPYQMIIAIVAIMVVVFMDTSLYKEFSDMVKVLIYGGLILLTILSGISVVDIKEIAQKLKEIMEDKKMSLWQKIQAFMNVGVEALSRAGDSWEIYDNEQFENAKQVEIDTLKAEIKVLEADLKSK